MQGDAAGGDGRRQRHQAPRPSGVHHPPSSIEATRMLIDLVAERLGTAAGTGLVVDVEGDVIRSPDQRWSAALAPLRASVAHVPTTAWSLVVDREIERWRRALAAVERYGGDDKRGHPSPAGAPIVLRLTSAGGLPSRPLRPAFGETAWELVRDLGGDGLASLTVPDKAVDGVAEAVWERVAAQTVARHRHRWGRLVLGDSSAIVLAGPHLSSLLFDTLRLRDHLGDHASGMALQATVFTNSLLLVTPGGGIERPTLDAVVSSLRRFTSDGPRHFEPFTIDLPDRGRL